MNVLSFQLKFSEEPETGLVLAENEDWVLVKHLPAEYTVDGYKLYRKGSITERVAGPEEERVARVLRLKGEDNEVPDGLDLADTLGILRWIEDNFGIFEFFDEEEMDVYYGRIHRAEHGLMIMEMIDADGHAEVDEDQDHVLERIGMIAFGSDYLYSLMLLRKDNLSRNGIH